MNVKEKSNAANAQVADNEAEQIHVVETVRDMVG